MSGLREKLLEYQGTPIVPSIHRYRVDAARIALEMVPCRHGTTDVTCITEETPRVRWCDRCRLLSQLSEKGGDRG